MEASILLNLLKMREKNKEQSKSYGRQAAKSSCKSRQEGGGHKHRSGFKTAAGLGLALSMLLTLSGPGIAFARQGDSGYEGGISSGETPSVGTGTTTSKAVYQYQEPVFLTGVPIVMSGDLTITKRLSTNAKTNVQTLTTTYIYALQNTGSNSRLARNLTFVTAITAKSNGQKTESTQLTRATETVTIDGTTYRIADLNDYSLSKAITNDYKPAVNYFAGTLSSRKTYHVGTATNTDTVIVETSGKYVGYDEYWSTAEAQILTQYVSQAKPGKALVQIGIVNMDISTTTRKDLQYYENQPEQISFEGGYILSQYNENVLKYTAKLSELDRNKAPTTKVNTYTNSLKLESYPVKDALVAPNLKQIKGHPQEKAMSKMFALEAYGNTLKFDPQEYMSRSEYVDAFVKVAKTVPLDPVFAPKKTTRTTKPANIVSSFSDVPASSTYMDSINEAAERGIISGNGESQFRPEALITVAEAVTMMVNSLGLSGLAPNPAPVTSFKDNDQIPSYARASIYVAEKLGLISEDAKGYIHPNDRITKAKAAEMMESFIDYMGSGIREEYMDRLLSY